MASSLEDDIVRIINLPTTKADRARALYRLGCDKHDVVELLDMAYSQAHSIWMKGNFDGGAGYQLDNVLAGSKGARGRGEHDSGDDGSGTWLDMDRGGTGSQGRGRPLRLSPSQVRYITQDGHVALRIDRNTGPICGNCGEPLTFELKYLGFVHTFSKSEPTDIEDHYR